MLLQEWPYLARWPPMSILPKSMQDLPWLIRNFPSLLCDGINECLLRKIYSRYEFGNIRRGCVWETKTGKTTRNILIFYIRRLFRGRAKHCVDMWSVVPRIVYREREKHCAGTNIVYRSIYRTTYWMPTYYQYLRLGLLRLSVTFLKAEMWKWKLKPKHKRKL